MVIRLKTASAAAALAVAAFAVVGQASARIFPQSVSVRRGDAPGITSVGRIFVGSPLSIKQTFESPFSGEFTPAQLASDGYRGLDSEAFEFGRQAVGEYHALLFRETRGATTASSQSYVDSLHWAWSDSRSTRGWSLHQFRVPGIAVARGFTVVPDGTPGGSGWVDWPEGDCLLETGIAAGGQGVGLSAVEYQHDLTLIATRIERRSHNRCPS